MAAIGLSAALAVTGCGTVANYWDDGQPEAAAKRIESTPAASQQTNWYAAQGFDNESTAQAEEPTHKATAGSVEAERIETASPDAVQNLQKSPSDLSESDTNSKTDASTKKTPKEEATSQQAIEPSDSTTEIEQAQTGWTYDAFAAEAARDKAKADGNSEGAVVSKDIFYGEWVEPVPGRGNRIQGYRFNPDGTAQSIGAMALKAKRWDLKGSILTIWGDDENVGFTIPFEVQFLVLQANDHLLHIREGGGPEMILQKRSR